VEFGVGKRPWKQGRLLYGENRRSLLRFALVLKKNPAQIYLTIPRQVVDNAKGVTGRFFRVNGAAVYSYRLGYHLLPLQVGCKKSIGHVLEGLS